MPLHCRQQQDQPRLFRQRFQCPVEIRLKLARRGKFLRVRRRELGGSEPAPAFVLTREPNALALPVQLLDATLHSAVRLQQTISTTRQPKLELRANTEFTNGTASLRKVSKRNPAMPISILISRKRRNLPFRGRMST